MIGTDEIFYLEFRGFFVITIMKYWESGAKYGFSEDSDFQMIEWDRDKRFMKPLTAINEAKKLFISFYNEFTKQA